MKSLIRSCVKVGIVGTAILGSWFVQNLAAIALPKEQIIEKLQAIPVFAVGDDKGLASTEIEGNKVPLTFISQEDAKKNIEAFKSKDPEKAKKLQVIPMSLGELYKVLSQENSKKKDGLNFAFVPVQTQVELAKKVTSNNPRSEQYKGGVPLFVARGGKEQGYLTIEQNNDKVIPFFFEKSQLEKIVDRFKKEKPELASTIKIEVVPLEGMINTLETSDNEMLNKVFLVPNNESIEFLRQQQPQQQKQ